MGNDDANIYAAARKQVRNEFAAYLSGADRGLFATVCSLALSAEARNALVKSAEALGYGPDGVTFITFDAKAPAPAVNAEALFRLIEGLDPVCLVCTDTASARLVGEAYRQDVPFMQPVHVFGRETRAFADLGALMDTPARKQQAWAQLKTLPRFKS